MFELGFPFLSLGLLAPLAAGVLLVRPGSVELARTWGALAAAFAAVMWALAGWLAARSGQPLGDTLLPNWLEVDALDAAPLLTFATLTLVTLLAAPKRDLSGASVSGILFILVGTSMAYMAGTVAGMVAGWWVSCVPGMLGAFGPRKDRLALIVQLLGCLALTSAAAFTGFDHENFEHTQSVAFGLLILAVALRKGIFPAHSWVLNAYDNGPLLPNVLLFNGHLGAMLLLRAESTPLAEAAQQILEWVSLGALGTALFASVAAIAQKRPRRILALLSVSQAAFILAGLGSRNVEGLTGALTHWLVVATATTGLACILRAVESRCTEAATGLGHLGLANRTPRLAVFFLVCGLALVGLPGTLGYCAEDLLFHGALASHPLLGLSLLIATALNAIHLVRLYSYLFLGRRGDEVPAIPDALSRERWALAACVVFLVTAGVLPSKLIAWRAASAERLIKSFTKSADPSTH
jgi:NADH-quinone oxidoreductase subunit M